MSFSQKILLILTSSSGGYRLLRKLYSSHPSYSADTVSDNTFRITLSRLKKHGFVENKEGTWSITSKGNVFLKNLQPRGLKKHIHYNSPSRHRKKSLIISFDIPEIQRKKRDWLRIELINLGFTQLHRSVWLGPAPLPVDFVGSLKELSLFPHMKFFAARKEEII